MKAIRIEYDRTKNGKFVTRIRAGNGEITLSGEVTERKARKMVQSLIDGIQNGDYEIVDRTKTKAKPAA